MGNNSKGYRNFMDIPPYEEGKYTVVLDNGIVKDMKYIPGKVMYPGRWVLDDRDFTSRVVCWRDGSSGEDRG